MSPEQVLNHHLIQGPETCVLWGLEFILKTADKIPLDDYRYQTAEPAINPGFGPEAKTILDSHGITATDDSFEWEDFEKHIKDEVALNRFPIFSLPTSVRLDLLDPKFGDFETHTFVAAPYLGELRYMGRIFQNPHVIEIPIQPFYKFLRSQIKPDYKIHCLSHRAKQAKVVNQ